jgi:adenine-specific DNA-methyltransferase
MPHNHFHEQQFFDALQDIFIGVEIEGESGFINLMGIKSRYYQHGVFPKLKQDIDQAVSDFPEFREELFDKLYTFFQRYFSESGSIYFRYTPLHQNIYEKVYTDDRNVVLFWKTHMLYYVKTDRIFNSLKAEVDGVKFFFDASKIEHKRANEKRDIVFSFRELAQDGTLVFDTAYSVRGRITKIEQILKDLRKEDEYISDETLEKAFRVFEKQSEVDYFINKNARAFLEEQFDLWLYQYLFAEKNIWSAERLAQLQALKAIAFKVIGFISQFEDELVKIWNKPKFVRNSHYILTLDHLIKRGKNELMEEIFAHNGIQKQIEEWVAFEMLESALQPDELLRQLTENDLTSERTRPKLQYLPLDTKHFSGLELQILACFTDLDKIFDGLIINSENYQALNTLQHKYRQKIKCIHIDPPYNTETSGFLYMNNYHHASWLTMMGNRIENCLEFLAEDGSLLCHIDENEYERLYLLLDSLNIPDVGTVVWDKRNPMNAGRGIANQHEYVIWRSFINSPIYQKNDTILSMIAKAKDLNNKLGKGTNEASEAFKDWVRKNNKLSGGEKAYNNLDEQGRIFQSVSLRAPEPRSDPKFFKPLVHPSTGEECPVPPNGFSRTPETLKEMLDKGEIIFGKDHSIQPRQKYFLTKSSRRQFSSIIQDARKGKSDTSPLNLEFPYCHPVSLYEEFVAAALMAPEGLVLDYFAGSGTTAHAVMNLNREDGGNRKYILVEMGDHFHEVILPRIKKVAFNSKWKDGKPVFEEGESGMSHFVKYYDLEQYEEVLKHVHYEDADLFNDPNQDPYHAYVFMRDLKLLESLEIDQATDKVHFHPERLYPDIDLAETLSHLRGKWIKRITQDFVEFTDGEQMSLTDPDWETLKPMVWWR